jgi:hypothetical protein
MSRSSLEATIAELYAFLAPEGVPAVTGVSRVYDHEPALGKMVKPVAVTIDDAGLTDLAYVIVVRIYHSTDVDAAKATATLRRLYQELDDLLTTHWGPTEWIREDDREIGALIASCRIEVGREDGKLRIGGGGL